MKKIKFIHTADLHLDTPFRSLASYNPELAGRLQDATLQSFDRIIDVCLDEQVDFLLVSGDIFDGESRSLAAQLAFVRGLQRLSDAGIYTYFICGNHDPLESWMDNLSLPPKVYRFDSYKVERIVFKKDGEPLAGIYGISYRTAKENRNLAGKYKLYGDPLPFSVALLHGTTGNPGPHAVYAPFRLEEIAGKGFDYWALGHIHKREILRAAGPAVAYPGNPQGRDFGETGRRGCLLVELTENLPPEIRFIPTQQIRFETVELDMTGATDINVLDKLIETAKTRIPEYEEEAGYILRIVLKGRTSLHTQLNDPEQMEILRNNINTGPLNPEKHFIRIDKISAETRPDIDVERIRKSHDFTAEVLKLLEQELPEDLLRETEAGITLHGAAKKLIHLDEEDKKKIMEKVKWTLLDRLVKNE